MIKPLSSSLLFFSSIVSGSLYAGEIHEWGTFTTVSGSDGTILSGLHVEEEVLPPFVYSHAGVKYHSIRYNHYVRGMQAVGNTGFAFKGFPHNYNLQNVTVKMETPVLYFYGEEREKYNIKVKFNGGTISQWYPQRSTGDKLPKLTIDPKTGLYTKVDFSKGYEGHIEWDVDVIPRHMADEALTFKPYQTLTWEYPRVSDANMLKVGNEYEDYLFYRGIGNFEQPVTFSVDSSDTVHMKNKSAERVPFAFAFENTGGKIRYSTFSSGIEAGESVKVTESDWSVCDDKTWRSEVFKQIRDGLVAQGLTLDESNGMVKTWWKSYFEHDGLRVFWVMPSGELDKILPIEISPKPEKLTRVIVGRSDILRPSYEAMLVRKLKSGTLSSMATHRFFEPFVQRLRQLVKVPFYAELTESVLLNQPFIFRYQQEKGTKVSVNQVTFAKVNINGKQVNRTSSPNTVFDRKEWELVMNSDESALRVGQDWFDWDRENHVLKKRQKDKSAQEVSVDMPLLLAKSND